MERLAQADRNLSGVVTALVSMTSQPGECASRLEEIATLVRTLQLSQASTQEHKMIEQQLTCLYRRACETEGLLESAAALHFGSFLHNGLVSGGYSTDGAWDSFGGGGFRIEG